MVGIEHFTRSFLRAGASALLLAALSSCQTDDFKPSAGEGGASAAVTPANDTGLYNQTLGSGSVKVAYLGVRRADQPSR